MKKLNSISISNSVSTNSMEVSMKTRIYDEMTHERIETIAQQYSEKLSELRDTINSGNLEFVDWDNYLEIEALAQAAQEVLQESTQEKIANFQMREQYKEFIASNNLQDTFDIEELLELGLLTPKQVEQAKEARVLELEWAQVNNLVGLDYVEQRIAFEEAVGIMAMENAVDLELEDAIAFAQKSRQDAESIPSYYQGKRRTQSLSSDDNNSNSFVQDDLPVDSTGITEQQVARSNSEISFGRAQEHHTDIYHQMGINPSQVRDAELDFIGTEAEIATLRLQEKGITKKLVKDLETQAAVFKQERDAAESVVAEFEAHAVVFVQELDPNKVDEVYAKSFLALDNTPIDFVDYHYQQKLLDATNSKRSRVGRGLIIYVDRSQCSESQIKAHEERVIANGEAAAFIGNKVGIYYDQYMTKKMRSVLYKIAKNFVAKKEAEQLASAFDKVAQWFDCLDASTKFSDAVENIVSELGMETLVLAVKSSWKGTKFSLIEYKVLQACGAVDQAKGTTPAIKDTTVKIGEEEKEVIEKLNKGVSVISVVNRSNAKKVLAAARAGERILNIQVYRAVVAMAK